VGRIKVEVPANQDRGVSLTSSYHENCSNEVVRVSKGVSILLSPRGEVKIMKENVHPFDRDDNW
jgi:hypothetical protein